MKRNIAHEVWSNTPLSLAARRRIRRNLPRGARKLARQYGLQEATALAISEMVYGSGK
jgi:hypothetical protein